MLRKTPTVLQFASLSTSRNPPQVEMMVVVRGVWKLVHEGVAEEIPDVFEQGFLTGDLVHDDDVMREGELTRASDFAHYKPAGEVLVTGACHAPGGAPTPRCPVGVTVGEWTKQLIAFGNRAWKPTGVGKTPSEPAPFTSLPLSWTRAAAHAKWNPVGVGNEDEALPNFEYEGQLITSETSKAAPAGFGPLNPEWPCRLALRGKNYGKEYEETRAPYFSDDFDWAHFHAAPLDQRISGYFRGDEAVTLLNLNADHEVLSSQLPGVRARAFVNDTERNFREIDLVLDTVTIDTEKGHLTLEWRGLTEVQDPDLEDITILYVDLDPLGEERTAEEYKPIVEKWEDDPLNMDDEIAKVAKIDPRAAEDIKAAMALQAKEQPPLSAFQPDMSAGAADPITQLLGSYAPGVGSDAQALATKGVAQASSDAATQGLEKTVNQALADHIATIPDAPPPPPYSITPGVQPRVSLSPQWDQALEYREKLAEGIEANMTSPDAPENPLGKIDEALGNPAWAAQDPLMAKKVAAFREKVGLPPAPELDEKAVLPPELPVGIALGAIGAGALALARFKAGMVPAPPMIPGGVPARPDGLHGPFGPDWGARKRDLIDEDLSHLELDYEDFSDCNLYGANLAGSNLRGVSFRNANLEFVNFYGADLTGCDFTGANLYMCMADSANLSQAKLVDCNLEVAIFNNAVMAGVNLKGAFAPYAMFSGARLTGAFGSGLHAPGANFDKAVLTGASFTSANLNRASMHDARAMQVDLSDSEMISFGASNTRFDGAILLRIKADKSNWGSSDLEGADLTAASLVDAFLAKTNLAKARLEWADLRGARMRRARLDFTRFGRASLVSAELAMTSCVETSFANANLWRTSLLDASISNCDFTGANVNRALIRQSS